VQQFPSDTHRPAARVVDVLAWTEEVVGSRQAGGQALGFTYEH